MTTLVLSTCETFASVEDPQVLELLQICFVRIKTEKQITVISHKSRAKTEEKKNSNSTHEKRKIN